MTDKSIQKALEQDARRISERIPMDTTRQQAQKVAESLQRFLTEKGWKQAKAARAIGVSTTQLNQFLHGKYKGNLKDLTNKIVNLINSVTLRERHVRNVPYIETTIAKRIHTLITQTEAFSNTEVDPEGKIGLIIGDGGHGKSHCLRQYAEANKNTVYVELDDTMTSTMIFSDIAKMTGIDSSGALASISRRLVENLQNRHIIIMLDEASSLRVKQLNQLRQTIVVKARCPLILAGNRHLRDTVMQPTTKRGCESLDQFTSRLFQILDLDLAASNKGSGLYTVDDIRKLYEYGGIKLTSDAVSTLRKIGKTPRSGRLRTCSHIITALHLSSLPAENKNTIDSGQIILAIEDLDLPVRVRLPLAIKEAVDEEQVQRAAKAG